ncbi:MAG: ammonium transporter [Myxococcales bacterium]|nr:ammonium transporter [Myxococcales bacterium]
MAAVRFAPVRAKIALVLLLACCAAALLAPVTTPKPAVGLDTGDTAWMSTLRVSADQEQLGLDLSQHDESVQRSD